jgi:hypothetical protein
MSTNLKDMRSVRVSYEKQALMLADSIRALALEINGHSVPYNMNDKMLNELGYCIYPFISEAAALKFRGEAYKLIPEGMRAYVRVEILVNAF